MKRPVGLSLGLMGRLLAILLVTITIEFGISTYFSEHSSRFFQREDEARRLAEHLVIARKLVSEQPVALRPDMAEQLTTNRYDIRWSPTRPSTVSAADLENLRKQVTAWEPALSDAGLSLAKGRLGSQPVLEGSLGLTDGSWLRFRAVEPPNPWDPLAHLAVPLLPPLLLAGLAALLFSYALRPVRTLTRAAERIGIGGGVTLPETGTQELRGLIRAFNAMQTRIRELIADRTQALAAVGHDLRTPLARLRLRADGISDPGTTRAMTADIAEMEEMLASLLAYLGGEDDPEAPARIDVAVMSATLVDAAVDQGRDAEYLGPDHCEAVVRPLSLKRALGNLVENALHYGTIVRVGVEQTAAELILWVEDDGPGIPADRIEEVTRPFSRLDFARGRNTKGLGLGLAIVTKAMEREGGSLQLANRAQGGLRAELRLPLR